MKIARLHIHHVRIPLRLAFAQANKRTRTSDSVVVRIQTTEGTVGYGESCPRTYVSGENSAGLFRSLGRLYDRLRSQTFDDVESIGAWTQALLTKGTGPAAVCALELALLDVWCKEHQTDLITILGGSALNTTAYSGVVPFGAWSQLEPILQAFSFPAIKFKAQADLAANCQRIDELRALFGPEAQIRLDANGAWSLDEARTHIEACLNKEVNSFEQPIAASHEKQMEPLVAEYGAEARIMADESIVTMADAERLVEKGRCNHFNLKLSKNGGILNTLRIYRYARRNGISCQLGAHYGETSILTAAGLVLAAMAPTLTNREGALGTYLLTEDIASQPLMIARDGTPPTIDTSFIGWPILIDPMQLNINSIRSDLLDW